MTASLTAEGGCQGVGSIETVGTYILPEPHGQG